MGQESNLWDRLSSYYSGFDGLLQRIESRDTAAGIPDVYFASAGVAGWIELKARKSFPVRKETCVRLETYTEHQRRWLAAAWASGVTVFICADIAGQSYWFLGERAVVVGISWNKHEFLANAVGIGDGVLEAYIDENNSRNRRDKGGSG